MRKSLFLFALLLFLPTFALAEVDSIDNGYSEKITSFGVDANLRADGSMGIKETITYDFGVNQKHGIYRYIPIEYKGRVGSKRQSLGHIIVTDNTGNNIPFERSGEGNSEVIKIGNADELVTGTQIYKISYTLSHMVSSNTDSDRLFWDAIGTGWNVPINNVVIKLSDSVTAADNRVLTRCYIGAAGSTSSCDSLQNGTQTIVAADKLAANSGITIDSTYKKNTFPAPSRLELLLWETRWYYALPIIALVAFFSLWYEKGRDPKGRGTIVPMYDPPVGMTPHEASLIVEEKISFASLPATIISLATRGFIKIHKKEVKSHFIMKPEYELEKLKPLPANSSPIDLATFDLFFSDKDIVSTKDLGESFSAKSNKLSKVTTQEVLKKGYFNYDPFLTQLFYFCFAGALAVIGVVLAIYFFVSPLGFFIFVAPGAIGLIFAIFMPVRTKAGVIAKEDLLGLKMYIKTAEIDRIKFHNAPAKSPEKFEELLPYAIIFGLEKEWAREFEDIYKTPPTWYDGNLATFTVVGLTHDMSSFSSTITSSAVSSGGGGVGGGGGGGGGGSW